jgi:TPR repeat protein
VWAGPFEDATAAYFRGDYSIATRLFRPLADQGDTSAQNNLGLMYNRGLGVPQDFAQASMWYRLAAEQGVASAQDLIGEMYDRGQGVPQHYAEAVKWYGLAADENFCSGTEQVRVHGHEKAI